MSSNSANSEKLSTYWQQQIDAWRESNLSQAYFCKKHDLIYHQFIYWRRKFEKTPSRPPSSYQNGGFAVALYAQEQDAGLSLTLPGGLVVQGLSESNLPLVRQLLETLS